jgi:hypothetical protein
VFEAAKAAHNRVKKMTGLPGDGAGLMGNAFKDDQPTLALADLSTQTGRRHAFGSLDPARTALVVVDMVPFFVSDSEYCRGIVPNISDIA